MTITITDLTVRDIRFPTSLELDGSDAMNLDPDYSAAYVTLHTDSSLTADGLTFTLGRGTQLCVQAVEALKPRLVGRRLDQIVADMAGFWRDMTGDSQLRWVGPEKGVVHLATAAIVNAVWDLYAKAEEKPVWQLLADMTPEQIVSCIDFRYISDALSPAEALTQLEDKFSSRGERIEQMLADGFPSYTTSAGWLGYSDDKLRQLCQDAIAAGWSHFKIKVGADLEDDKHRCRIIREEIGWDRKLMMDANQVWDVDQAIANMKELAEFEPWWIEEPTSPDDILGHAAIGEAIKPIGIASGEACQNRVIFKQLLQAGAISFCQIDSCRLGGVNEVISVIMMADKFSVPVCPHAGGVGLCEYIQHLALFDFICVSGSLENRLAEYVDHLHEHFLHPVIIRDGHYMPPQQPGYSISMKEESLAQFEYPDGPVWRDLAGD
jgi:L-fuconate dehydratase